MANPASITITELTLNGQVNQPATQAIDTEASVPVNGASLYDRLILEVINLAAVALTVIVKAGTAAQAAIAKDLSVAMAATGSAGDKKIIGPFESARFVKADGSIDVFFDAVSGSPNATVRCYRLPRNA